MSQPLVPASLQHGDGAVAASEAFLVSAALRNQGGVLCSRPG